MLFAGAVGLFSLACLYFVDKFYRFPELIEFAAQIGAPLLLAASLKYGLRAVYGLKVAIALTFAGHGFYALGFYPRPAGFTTMIMNIWPLTEDQSHGMLLRVGFVDMLAALLIFIPSLSRFALMYCISWGFLLLLPGLPPILVSPHPWRRWSNGCMRHCFVSPMGP